MKLLLGMLVLALALVGCSSSDGGGGSKDEAQAEESAKDVFSTGGYKADCYDCDPEGDHAFRQLGLSDRFWKVGDAWQVLYLLRTDTRVQMEPLKFQAPVKESGGVIVLDFNVVEAGTAVIGGVERKTATLRITQGDAQGSLGQLVEGQTVRADEVTAKVDLVIDDLFRAISVTEYSGPRGAFPNGKVFQTDPKQALRSLDSSFPYVVPNAYLGAEKTRLPELPDELAQIAGMVKQGYQSATYFHFDLKGQGHESGEQVFWAEGDLWPFYVETSGALGVLVSQNN